MSEYIDTLLEALYSIDLNNCAIDENDIMKFINERSFAYELYRTWYETKPSNLVLNAEITKIIEEKFEKRAFEIFEKEIERFYPDLVLHGGQKDHDHQEIICEIKVVGSNFNPTSLLKDLRKLKAYTTKDDVLYHEFLTGIFILAGGDSDKIAETLTAEAVDLIISSKILFVSVLIDGKKVVPTIKTPSEIIEIRNNLKNNKI